MFKYFWYWCTFFVCAHTLCQPIQQPSQQPLTEDHHNDTNHAQNVADEDQESSQRIILAFASIAKSFFNIAGSKDPKDPVMLGCNLTEMAAGIVKIAMEMFRTRPLIDDEMVELKAYVPVPTESDLALIKHVTEEIALSIAKLQGDTLE